MSSRSRSKRRKRSKTASKALSIAGIAVLAIAALGLTFVALTGVARPEASADYTPRVYTPTPKPPIMSERVEGESLKISFLGTSLGSGYFASSPESAYKGLITSALEVAGPVEVGVVPREPMEPGAPTVLTTYDPAKIAPDQDIIFMELGTNDGGNTSFDEFRERYRFMIDTMQQNSPDAKFICFGPWQADPGGLQQIIQQEGPGSFVSLTELFNKDEMHGPEGRDTPFGPGDLFHPNDAGHAAIATAAEKKLTPFLIPAGQSIPAE